MLFPLNPGPLHPGVGVINGWAITSYFGGRIDPLTGKAGNHGGMDLAFSGCTGQPMIACVDGWLTQSWDSSGGGNWNGLTAPNGDYFGYGHAQAFEPTGGRSRNVKAGDVIGYVGTTGGSTGPHLHFAYRPAGASGYRDPYDLLVAAASVPAVPNVEPDPIPSPSEEDDDMPRIPLVQLASTPADSPWSNSIGIAAPAQYSLTDGITLRWCSAEDVRQYQQDHADGVIEFVDLGEKPDTFFDARVLAGRKRPDGGLTS